MGIKYIPREAANECDKLIEICRPHIADHCTERNDAEAEEVLQPLDAGVALSTALEETGLHDTDCGEKLKRNREQDGSRIEELDLRDEDQILKFKINVRSYEHR
jgi:hypothetical protein